MGEKEQSSLFGNIQKPKKAKPRRRIAGGVKQPSAKERERIEAATGPSLTNFRKVS